MHAAKTHENTEQQQLQEYITQTLHDLEELTIHLKLIEGNYAEITSIQESVKTVTRQQVDRMFSDQQFCLHKINDMQNLTPSFFSVGNHMWQASQLSVTLQIWLAEES